MHGSEYRIAMDLLLLVLVSFAFFWQGSVCVVQIFQVFVAEETSCLFTFAMRCTFWVSSVVVNLGTEEWTTCAHI